MAEKPRFVFKKLKPKPEKAEKDQGTSVEDGTEKLESKYTDLDYPDEEQFNSCIQDIDFERIAEKEQVELKFELEFIYIFCASYFQVSAQLLRKDRVEPEKEKPGKLESKNTDMDFIDEEQFNLKKTAEKKQVELKFKLQFIYIFFKGNTKS